MVCPRVYPRGTEADTHVMWFVCVFGLTLLAQRGLDLRDRQTCVCEEITQTGMFFSFVCENKDTAIGHGRPAHILSIR